MGRKLLLLAKTRCILTYSYNYTLLRPFWYPIRPHCWHHVWRPCLFAQTSKWGHETPFVLFFFPQGKRAWNSGKSVACLGEISVWQLYFPLTNCFLKCSFPSTDIPPVTKTHSHTRFPNPMSLTRSRGYVTWFYVMHAPFSVLIVKRAWSTFRTKWTSVYMVDIDICVSVLKKMSAVHIIKHKLGIL